jgi:hypothetical protein
MELLTVLTNKSLTLLIFKPMKATLLSCWAN